MKNNYNADNIQVLSDRDHIRLRKGMYIGEGLDPRQLLSEIFDNAIDEVQAGFSPELLVTINTKENKYTVRDWGRGIPHGKKKLDTGEEKEVLEILITKSNSGGKFDNSSYKYSCFTEDTKVKLTDGRSITFKELLKEYNEGKINYTYTCDTKGTISITPILKVAKTNDVNQIIEITLDNNEKIRCTLNHLFLTREGNFVQAKDLKLGESLMPGRFGNTEDIFKNYNAIWDNKKETFVLCHKLADEYNINKNIYTKDKTNIHHKDFNRYNNPDNLIRLTRSEHSSIHAKASLKILKETNPEAYKNLCKNRSNIIKEIWKNLPEEKRMTWLQKSILSEESRTKSRQKASQILTNYNKSEKGRKTSQRMGRTVGIKNFRNYVYSDEGRKQHSDILKKLNSLEDFKIKAKKNNILISAKSLLNSNLELNEENFNKYKAWCVPLWKNVLKYFNDYDDFKNQATSFSCKKTIEELKELNERHRSTVFKNQNIIQRQSKRGSILKSINIMLKNNIEITEENYNKNKLRNAKKWNEIFDYFEENEDIINLASKYNHQVIKIEIKNLDYLIPVYDLTVESDNHTFLLDSGVFVHNCGLNGLGLTITNALSKHLMIASFRDGNKVQVICQENGSYELIKEKTEELNGTIVEFIPDKKMFKSSLIPQDFIINRCRIASALGFRARLIIDGKEIKTDSNIFDLIFEEDPKIVTYTNINEIAVTNSDNEKMKVALRYTSDVKDRYFGFTNLLSNYLGGTHIQVLSKTIINVWTDFINKHKNIKPSIDLKPSDYLVGLRGVCAVFISKPEFSSQTKEKLVVSKDYFTELMNNFSKQLYKYLEENIVTAQQLIKRFEEYRLSQNALLSRKEISSLIKVNDDSSDNIRRRSVVSKLVECTSRSKKGSELFICEGDSALGPYLYVRDKATQAILPLRGKILNVTTKDLKEAIQNKEICDIANSIGCGIGSSCDASKSRYEKIIISADADPDGLQITCLILSLFVNFFADLVKQGHVYITIPPLYCWGDSNKTYGWCNKVNDIPKHVKDVHRFKGLGEMQPEQLNYFLVNKQTRNIIQVEYPSDVDEFNKILGTSEGKGSLLKDLGIIKN